MLLPPPPLHPSGAEGRRLLREELLHAEYHRQNVFQRILDWLARRLDHGVGAASGSAWVTTLVTMALVALLVVGLAWVLTRLRRDRRRRAASDALLPEHHATAAELRRRAEAALREGRHDAALVDAFRAVAARQVERGRIDDQPGATVHEVAARLAATYPTHGSRVGRTAELFDATMYGHRAASHEEAAEAIDLDDTLAGAR
jgi:Domain of unknown function (DUF4129)